MGERVHQEDEDKLKGTVKQKEKDRTVTGSVTANAGTNLNTSSLAITHTEQDPFEITGGGTRETQIGLLYGYDSTTGKWLALGIDPDSLSSALNVYLKGQAGNITVAQDAKDRTVTNAVAANLKAEVTQASAARTITSGDITVAPSGDMARKAYYDRNAEAIVEYASGNQAAGQTTVMWTYTVPSDHIANHTLFYDDMAEDIVTGGRLVIAYHHVSIDAGSSYSIFSKFSLVDTKNAPIQQTIVSPFTLFATDKVKGTISNSDTVSHGFDIAAILAEFDA